MTRIRPISDLRNKYTEIEKEVQAGTPVFLTKNGYGSMVVMSIERYDELTDSIELKLDEADEQAAHTSFRYAHDELFDSVRAALHGNEAIQA